MAANSDKTILSLCDFSGNWVSPYRNAGYNVIQVDLKLGDDIRLYNYPGKVHGILAAPPCTHFAVSGARWWKSKGEGPLLEGLALIDACMRIIAVTQPDFWVLENPVGRLKNYLGPYHHIFNPCDYAGYLADPSKDAYTKKTCLWGKFNVPVKKEVTPIKVCAQGSWVQKLGGKSDRTKELRSMTPMGFAQAFFEANP